MSPTGISVYSTFHWLEWTVYDESCGTALCGWMTSTSTIDVFSSLCTVSGPQTVNIIRDNKQKLKLVSLYAPIQGARTEAERQLMAARDRGAPSVIGFFDIDGLKAINDRVVMHTKLEPHRTYLLALSVERGSVPAALGWDTPDPYHYLRVQDIGDGHSAEDLGIVANAERPAVDHSAGAIPVRVDPVVPVRRRCIHNIDHALVGHLVGYTGNAAIGVALQIFIVVIVFINSLFTGMSVLVARFAGAGEEDKVDRTVYQAFLTAIGLALLVMAPLGYAFAPSLLDLVNATPAVKAEALPFLRIMFLFSSGMMVFYMLSGALRAAGDARTPMVLGVVMTVLNLVLNIVLIRGLGPIPAFGTAGSAMGTCIASGLVTLYAMVKLWRGGWVVSFPRHHGFAPDWTIIRSLFRFGLPTGVQGIAMNVAGVTLLRFIGSLDHSAAAQAAYAVGYTELFSLITWTSVGLMGAAAAVRSELTVILRSGVHAASAGRGGSVASRKKMTAATRTAVSATPRH